MTNPAMNEYGEIIDEEWDGAVRAPSSPPQCWILPTPVDENRELVKRIWHNRKGRSVMWPCNEGC